MREPVRTGVWVLLVLAPAAVLRQQDAGAAAETRETVRAELVTISVQLQHREVRPGGKSALAIQFELAEGWHFYASGKTAPGGMNLKLKPISDANALVFGEAIFPKPEQYFDKTLRQNIDLFSGKFTVYLPFAAEEVETRNVTTEVSIEGAICTESQCRVPDFGKLVTEVKIAADANMAEGRFELPQASISVASGDVTLKHGVDYTLWAALGLAFIAGLSLNVMPCVWPVLPIVVMRLVEQAKQSRGKSIAMGLAFCAGVLLFFAALAGANIILQQFYGTALQWGDQFREPAFVGGMAILLVVLALFMFGLFEINLPSGVGSNAGAGQGYVGAVGMGFLAAILSTPCSFGILAAAFAWAQAQPAALGTLAIMIIGVGMAAPYAVLTAMPGLLAKTPRPGRWMELFKQTIGFVLLVIAVKLIAALPQNRRMDFLYFSVVLAFCVWMWGGWVSFGTPSVRKWIVRGIAVMLGIAAGFAFLPAAKEGLIEWQQYDEAAIAKARGEDRGVLIKFTADWCLSCQVVEKVVYGREDIANLIKDKTVLAIKADTTVKDYPATIALKEVYGEPGVPVTIMLMPGDKEAKRWRGMGFGDELEAELSKL